MDSMTSWLRGFSVCALALMLVGCQQDGPSGTKSQSEAPASAAAEKPANTMDTKNPAPTTTAEPPMQSVSHTPAPTPPSAAASTEDDFESEASRRKQTESMIYATIRIKMEEAIEKRASLLSSGKAPSDEEVRSLEGTIMRARELLEENGEVVEPVDPPIVQSVPNP
ncbi:MAG TPA: hypothetical protein VJZ71_09995 [Phycisphaerae bacterium]|nr:hypothetical protein [Phycisphaerae bacterium]